jgi:hypothetical protein
MTYPTFLSKRIRNRASILGLDALSPGSAGAIEGVDGVEEDMVWCGGPRMLMGVDAGHALRDDARLGMPVFVVFGPPICLGRQPYHETRVGMRVQENYISL